jgi:hypothetical protein
MSDFKSRGDKQRWRWTLTVVGLIVSAFSIIWFVREPGYESGIACFTSVGVLVVYFGLRQTRYQKIIDQSVALLLIILAVPVLIYVASLTPPQPRQRQQLSATPTLPPASTSISIPTLTSLPIIESTPIPTPLPTTQFNRVFSDTDAFAFDKLANTWTITAPMKTDHWAGVNTAPLLTLAREGDFDFQTKMIFTPEGGKQVAGIGVRAANDYDTWIRVVKDHANEVVICDNEQGEAGCYDKGPTYDSVEIYFRIKRSGNYFALYYSPDGQEWRSLLVDVTINGMPREAEIFMLVYSTDENKLATAEFSEIQLK